MNLQKLSPWNWFSRENANAGSTVPVKRDDSDSEAKSVSGSHPALQLRREIDRLFDDAFRGFPSLGSRWLDDGIFNRAVFQAKVNIASDDKAYHISLEAPGLTDKDISLEVNRDALTIRGEKKEESETKERHYYRMERSYGSFQRVLALPEDADQNSINASMKNGVLEIVIARKALPAGDTKRIPIN